MIAWKPLATMPKSAPVLIKRSWTAPENIFSISPFTQRRPLKVSKSDATLFSEFSLLHAHARTINERSYALDAYSRGWSWDQNQTKPNTKPALSTTKFMCIKLIFLEITKGSLMRAVMARIFLKYRSNLSLIAKSFRVRHWIFIDLLYFRRLCWWSWRSWTTATLWFAHINSFMFFLYSFDRNKNNIFVVHT